MNFVHLLVDIKLTTDIETDNDADMIRD